MLQSLLGVGIYHYKRLLIHYTAILDTICEWCALVANSHFKKNFNVLLKQERDIFYTEVGEMGGFDMLY